MKWNPVDILVMIFALCIVLVIVLSLSFHVKTGIDLSIDQSKIIENIIMSMISVILMYVGYRAKNQNDG